MSACGILYATGGCERRCDRQAGHAGPCSGDLQDPAALLLRDALEALREIEMALSEARRFIVLDDFGGFNSYNETGRAMNAARAILARAESEGMR